MSIALSDFIDTYELSTQQRKFSLNQVAEVLTLRVAELSASKKKGDADVLGQYQALQRRVGEALEHEVLAADIESRYETDRKKPQGSPELKAVDVEMDRLLGRFVRIGREQGGGADDTGAQIAAMMLALAPNGADAITTRTNAEQFELVNALLEKTHGDKAPYAELIKEAGLRRVVQEIAKLQETYGALVKQLPPDLVGYDKVRAARATGQNNLRRVIAGAIFIHGSDSPADVEARVSLLSPIAAQLDKAEQAAKRGRTRTVDPEAPAAPPTAASPGTASPASSSSPDDEPV